MKPMETTAVIAVLAMGTVFAALAALRAMQQGRKLPSLADALGQGTPVDMRQVTLSRPWSERVLRPLLRRVYRMGRALTPSRNIEQLQHNLIVAGLPGGLTVTDFLGLRFLIGVALATIAAVTLLPRQTMLLALTYTAVAFLVGLYAPNIWLSSKAKARQKAIGRALPDALDLMSICVDAGLGFEAAIQKVAYQSNDALSLEMRRVISEIRVGVSRSDALRHLADRTDVPDVASFVGVLVQADRLGIAIRNVLSTQSVQMRIQRRQRAQESAAKAPIKMMIPMVLFIFPALFAVILGPAIPRLMGMFG